jgi:hypothetical protein
VCGDEEEGGVVDEAKRDAAAGEISSAEDVV